MDNDLPRLLCPPGNGVFTVNTAKDKKQSLHQLIYGNSDPEQVSKAFYEQLALCQKHNDGKVAILGVASDCGGGIQRGANWGPLFVREAIYHANFTDQLYELGDVRVIPHLLDDKYLNDATIQRCQHALYGAHGSQLPVSPLSIAYQVVTQFYQMKPKGLLFSLGGDHSVSYPLMKAYLEHKRQLGQRVGLVHFDAHTDLLVERLGIDICFGSWLTHVLDLFHSPQDVVQLGIRSSGQPKQHWQDTFGIHQYWMNDINDSGHEYIAEQVIEHFNTQDIDEIYVSFDIDALDASIASATGTPEPDGMQLNQAIEIINKISEHYPITGADLVEVAPLVNPTHTHSEPEATLHSALSIAQTLITAML